MSVCILVNNNNNSNVHIYGIFILKIVSKYLPVG